MKKKHLPLFALLAVFLSSCNLVEDMGMGGLVVLFGLMLSLFGLMFYLIFKRRRQADKSLAQFSYSIQEMLKKFDTPEDKIATLLILVERINEDEKYKKDPKWQKQVLARTYLYLSTQYYGIGDTEKTLATCTKILEVTPDDAMTLYNRGSMYSNIGKYDEALTDLDRSIELVADYASSYNNRGSVFDKLGRDDEAIADFNKALELEQSPFAYYNRGNVYHKLNNIELAKADYNSALQVSSECDDQELRAEIERAIEKLN